jgi:hypothetical protein
LNLSYRFSFPFGRPEGALRATLSLLERVLMKDIVTPVPPEEVRGMIKSCLETAAHVNYERLSSEAKICEDFNGEVCVPPGKKLEDLIHLAEICVDLLQQNEEHYSEVLVRFLELSVHCLRLSRQRVACLKMDLVRIRTPPQKTINRGSFFYSCICKIICFFLYH